MVINPNHKQGNDDTCVQADHVSLQKYSYLRGNTSQILGKIAMIYVQRNIRSCGNNQMSLTGTDVDHL